MIFLEVLHPQHGLDSGTFAIAQPPAPLPSGLWDGAREGPCGAPFVSLFPIPGLGLDEGLEACRGAPFVSTLTPLFSL